MAKAKKAYESAEAYTGKNGEDHRAGTIKNYAHMLFDTKGRDAAIKFVEGEGLQETTAKVWTSTWGRKGARRAAPAAAKAKPARKAAVKGKTTAKRPARAKAKAATAKAE